MTDDPRAGRFFRAEGGLGTIGSRLIVNRPRTRVEAMPWQIPHESRPPETAVRLVKSTRSGADEWAEACRISLEGGEADDLFVFLSECRAAMGYNETTEYVVLRLDRSAPDAPTVTRLLRYFSEDPKLFVRVAEHIDSGEIDALLQATNVIRIQRATKELETLVEADELEDTYRKWFEEHPWVFGSEYVERIPLRTIGLDAQADVLLRTADGFSDVFEIKRPDADVLVLDRSHNNWRPGADLAIAFGQAVRYLDHLSEQQLVIQQRYRVPAYRPRVRIVAGRSSDWNEEQHRALRGINAHWHGVEVLTYDMVLARARTLIGHLVRELTRD